MKLFFALFISLLVALTAAAQSPASILKSAEKALGGKKRLAAVQGGERRGTVARPAAGTNGRFKEISLSPGSYYVGYVLNGFEVELGSNGRSGRSCDSRRRLATLNGDL